MKKNLLKTMAVAMMLLAGMGAQAQQTKKVLYSADFETGVATDYWQKGNGGLMANRHNGGTVAGIKASKDRGDYIKFNATYTEGHDYTIEFDFYPVNNNRHHEMAVMSESAWGSWTHNYGYFWKTDKEQEHNAFLFFFEFSSTSATINKGYGDDSGDAMTFVNGKWHHVVLNVAAATRTVKYTITQEDDDQVNVSGSYTLPEGESTNCKGIYVRNSRYNYNEGSVGLDNIEIYEMVEGVVAQKPTVVLTKVDGNDRIYTITINEGETLCYTIPGGTEQTSTEKVTEVRVSQDGDLVAYTKIGDVLSETVTTAVTTGAVTLATPTFAITDIAEGEAKTYTVSIDNSGVLLQPEATLSWTFAPADASAEAKSGTGNVIAVESLGTILVQAEADGYTSSTLTIENDKAYELTKAFKFNEMTAADFSSDLWTAASGELRDNWTNNASAIPADATFYRLTDPNSETIPNCLEGLTLGANRQPNIYIGYGLLTPYAPISSNGGNNLNINVNDAAADELILAEGWNNYGASTFRTVQAATATFGLYRYDTMLWSISVYSPKTDLVDGISETVRTADAAAIYNLGGQRVEKAVKGLYIIDGKKVVVK